MSAAILIDLLLAALLGATIVYAVVLNRRLATFRQGKEELGKMIADFSVATEKARAGLDDIKAAGETSAKALKAAVDQANMLRDDLGFLIERGTVIADHLAQDVRASRAGAGARPAANDPAAQLRKILQATR